LAPNDLYIEIICPIAVLDEVSAENVLFSGRGFMRPLDLFVVCRARPGC
jgi:hypothetical protein